MNLEQDSIAGDLPDPEHDGAQPGLDRWEDDGGSVSPSVDEPYKPVGQPAQYEAKNQILSPDGGWTSMKPGESRLAAAVRIVAEQAEVQALWEAKFANL